MTDRRDRIERLCNEIRKHDIGISRWYREQAHSMRVCAVREEAWSIFEDRLRETLRRLDGGIPLDPFTQSFSRKDDTP
jgi:hypothetical protein